MVREYTRCNNVANIHIHKVIGLWDQVIFIQETEAIIRKVLLVQSPKQVILLISYSSNFLSSTFPAMQYQRFFSLFDTVYIQYRVTIPQIILSCLISSPPVWKVRYFISSQHSIPFSEIILTAQGVSSAVWVIEIFGRPVRQYGWPESWICCTQIAMHGDWKVPEGSLWQRT